MYFITQKIRVSAQVSGVRLFAGRAKPDRLLDAQKPAPQVQTESLFTTQLITTTSPVEIVELAHALQNDPKLIYDYVHNHIEYQPYFASMKGAVLTLLEQAGNDFDQASLMIELLRASGYTAQYVFGTITVPGTQMVNWMGVNNPRVIGKLLANGGIPVVTVYTSGKATFEHVWVQASINGSNYVFDPSFKIREVVPGIDIALAMGYNRASFLNSVLSGATVTTDYIQNVSQQNLSNVLTQESSALVNTIRSQYANASVEEIISGRRIIQSELVQYQANLQFATTTTAIWDSIPQAYVHTLNIQHQGINHTFNIPELSGKRITLTYNGAAQPELRLDGNVVATGNATSIGQFYNFRVAVNHAYATTAFNQARTYPFQSGSTYAVFYNFGGDSTGVLEAHSKILDKLIASGLPGNSEQVLGETLHIMGMTWANENRLISNVLLPALADTIPITHHRIGVVGQEGGYFFDVKNLIGSTISRNNITRIQVISA